MPVRRLRSLQEAEDSLVIPAGDARLWPVISACWQFSARLCPRRFPPGLYRHRSIEEHNRQREQWDRQAILEQAGR